METVEIAGCTITVFRAENAEVRPVVYLHTAAEDGAQIFEAAEKCCTLICVSGIDWNADMSPWPAKRAFKGGEDFSGRAGRQLERLETQIIPAVEKKLGFVPGKRGIAGYSLGGLFALWCLYNSAAFTLAASASGSLWFDGWLDYIRESELRVKADRVYISVGDREKNARDQRMRMVEDNSRETARLLSAKFELNEGNHFKESALRMAKGLRYISGE